MVRDFSISEDKQNPPFLYLVVSGAVFGALGSTVVSGVILYLENSNPNFSSLLFWAGYVCVPTGMIAGMLGSIWLGMSVQRNQARLWLILQGTLAGIVLGLPVLILTTSVRSNFGKFFPCLVGAIVGGCYALIFHSLLIKCRRSDRAA